jgi:hypothetical protein
MILNTVIMSQTLIEQHYSKLTAAMAAERLAK